MINMIVVLSLIRAVKHCTLQWFTFCPNVNFFLLQIKAYNVVINLLAGLQLFQKDFC